jgi:hypothetical protein
MNTVIALKGHNQKKASGAPVANAPSESSHPPQTDENALWRMREKLVALTQRSNTHTFELGETFAEAKALLPEKKFGQWLKQFTDYTVRSAWNYISVHERLQDYREPLLSHAVMPTVMFELAKGEPDQIAAVVARMNAGDRIRVKDVKAALAAPKEKRAVSPLDAGGIAGLRKAAQLKTDQDVAAFYGLAASVLKAVEIALEPLAKKRKVKKGDLQDAVKYDCRHAHDLLNSIAAPLQPDVTAHLNWRAAKLPADTSWRKVQALLHVMGGEDWPDYSTAFVPWLQGEVVPLLRFVVHGEALVFEADTPVDQNERVSEAGLPRVA